MNIVSLGKTACLLAEKFKQYPQYKIYQIDNEERKKSRYYLKLPVFASGYEYEQKIKVEKFEKFFKGIKDEILFITCGFEPISLLSLVTLQQLSKCSKVSVLYVRPDAMFLSEEKRNQEELVSNTLQSYALYDFIEQIYLMNNLMVEKMIEDIDMENYYDKINDAISWVVHTLNFCDNQSPISDNFVSKENYGIKTIGITDFDEKGEEKMFYSIDKVREKKYYYLISKEDFKKDKNLLNKIRESIKEKTKNSKEKIYYGIYSSEIEKNMIISVYQTMTVQNGR